jgi:hypothetical protein
VKNYSVDCSPIGLRPTATDDVITEIGKLGNLRDSGTLTDEEFSAFEAKALN